MKLGVSESSGSGLVLTHRAACYALRAKEFFGRHADVLGDLSEKHGRNISARVVRNSRTTAVRWVHAAEELDDDYLSILDLESIILTGEIIERQRDTKTLEVKCVIRGTSLEGITAEALVKLGPTGKLFVITVYVA